MGKRRLTEDVVKNILEMEYSERFDDIRKNMMVLSTDQRTTVLAILPDVG